MSENPENNFISEGECGSYREVTMFRDFEDFSIQGELTHLAEKVQKINNKGKKPD